MRYKGYVADLDEEADAYELDFEDTYYQEVDAVLVSKDRIRLEWTENDALWAVTISQFYESEDITYGHGEIEICYETWGDRRSVHRSEKGTVETEFIARRTIKRLSGLTLFWIDVR